MVSFKLYCENIIKEFTFRERLELIAKAFPQLRNELKLKYILTLDDEVYAWSEIINSQDLGALIRSQLIDTIKYTMEEMDYSKPIIESTLKRVIKPITILKGIWSIPDKNGIPGFIGVEEATKRNNLFFRKLFSNIYNLYQEMLRDSLKNQGYTDTENTDIL